LTLHLGYCEIAELRKSFLFFSFSFFKILKYVSNPKKLLCAKKTELTTS
jgi:hypothetical protein